MHTLADALTVGRTWSGLDDFQAFIDAGGMVEPGDDMPEEFRSEVFRFIEFHANSELMGGLTERDWIPHAPGLRLKQIFLAKTQDEIGHAHLLYMVAADMGVKTRTEMLEQLFDGRSRFHNVFHYKAVTWADQVAIAFLVDAEPARGVCRVHLWAVQAGSQADRCRRGIPYAPRRRDAAASCHGHRHPAKNVPGRTHPMVVACCTTLRA